MRHFNYCTEQMSCLYKIIVEEEFDCKSLLLCQCNRPYCSVQI